MKTYELMGKNHGFRELLLYNPTNTEYENLRTWYISNCVISAFLTITAIVFNGITIKRYEELRHCHNLLKHCF